MSTILIFITRTFPVWAILLSVVAFYYPEIFIPHKNAIIPLLMIIMFGMGITLSIKDFRYVWHHNLIIAIGVIVQFTIMPLAAFLISKMLALPESYLIGMVLVGTTAGGTASNVICYLARANVALSITLTMVSTLVAIVAMPALTWLYLHETVPVPVFKMLQDLTLIVLVPVTMGVALNSLFHNKLVRMKPFFPVIAIISIILIIAIIVALNQNSINNLGTLIISAVIVHNLIGLGSGYLAAKLLGYDQVVCRTLAIEIGMQNSGLSAALANSYFTSAAALPAALFSIWHNLTGATLASIWSSKNKLNLKQE